MGLDNFAILVRVLTAVWWLIPVALLLAIVRSSWFKGMAGEAAVNYLAKLRLPASTYHRFHNVTLPTSDGSTQVDHIVVSRFGVFVVETKNMKGWILGGEHQARWTQQIYRRSYPFQNPLRQNYRHVKAVESALQVPGEWIHSVVVFVGTSRFKTPMPANVLRGSRYIGYIKSFRQPVMGNSEVERIVAGIREGRLAPGRSTDREHVEQLKRRHNTSAQKPCPTCGNNMVIRRAKKGEYAGRKFWGCSEFPKCRTVLRVD